MSTDDTQSLLDLELINARERARSQLFGLPPPATRVDRFTLLDQLGAGGMGVVFAAYDPELDRRVALKLLRTEPSAAGNTGQAAARLQREAQAMARVSHPNVITVFEVGRVDGQIFIAMEYVAGQTLARWFGAERREVSEILGIFEQAGRGLVAAHAAGLVHRDFKPTNVMIGDDGRVRVLDFGLARPYALAEPLQTQSELESGIESELESGIEAGTGPHRLLDAPLTQTGALVGTPAYMAPEQIRGHRVDAKTDQFAFCVVLYEALYGQAPFEGRSLLTLTAAIEAGEVREPPDDRKVPRAVRTAIERGLSVDPRARYPSLEALLAAIRPRPKRRWWWVAASMLATAVLVALLLPPSPPASTPAPCHSAAAPMQEVWNEPRATAIAASFTQTGAPFAEPTWASVASQLEDYAARWSAQRVSACEATRVHGTQSAALLDRRMACLDGGRRELDALLEVWGHADRDTVANATRAVASLPAIERCEDAEALLEGIDLPSTPELAEQVEQVRERLARLRAQERVGRYHPVLPDAIQADEHAQTIEYPPLQAEGALVRGRLTIRTGDYRGAEEPLHRAYELGIAHRHDEVAVEAAVHLALSLGYHLADYDAGMQWVRHAAALLQRSGGTGKAQREVLRQRALLFQAQGQLEQARQQHEEGLGLAIEEHGEFHHETAMVYYNLGLVLSALGRSDEAVEHHEKARAVFEALGGPQDPDVAYPLYGLASEARRGGRLIEARALLERAQEIREQALGPEHFILAGTLSELAIIATSERRLDDATALIERALAIIEARFGPDHLHMGRALINLGHVHFTAGRLEQAQAINRRVISIFERSLGPEHPLLLHALSNRASIAYELGDVDGAVAEFWRLLPMRERAFGREHPRVAAMLDDIGDGLVTLGRPNEAIPLHERALGIYEASYGAEHLSTAKTLVWLGEALLAAGKHERALEIGERVVAIEGVVSSPEVLADGRYLIARAHWEAGHRADARQQAAEAEAAYVALGEGYGDRVTEVQRWRRGH
ncbi:MAG: serine/threonine-protein kinase [Myxococcota bacterium]